MAKIKVLENTLVKIGKGVMFGDSIIDSGENFLKLEDGILIQWGEVKFNFDINRGWGGWFYGSHQNLFKFPIKFKKILIFDSELTSGSGTSFVPAQYVITNYTEEGFFGFSGVRPNSATGAVGVVNYIAIGTY